MNAVDPSSPTSNHKVVDGVFDRLVEQAACRGLLDADLSIDSTDVRTMPADQDASKATINRRRVLPRLRLYDRLDRAKRSIAAPVHRGKQAPEETAMRVTCDALAVEETDLDAWNSAYDTLGWHDHLLAAGVVPVAP